MSKESVRKWDNGTIEFDLSESSRAMNPFLENYGRDRYTYKPEMTYTSAVHYARTEASQSHGYPKTAYLQVGIAYLAGLYTARE
jgi:hypothetical protein